MPACSSGNSSPPMSLAGTPLSTSPTRISESTCSGSLSRSSSTLSQRRRRQPQPQPQQQQQQQQRSDDSILSRIARWYLGLASSFLLGVFSVVGYAIRAPALWASVWLRSLRVILQLPLTALKWFITVLHTPAYERSRNKRCVLISGGSTVQAVHLARNFYKAGARVVVCELEDLFGLARFSTACSRYYTIPRPGPRNVVEYIKALRDIVQRERAAYYIPVSAANAAYYDALAKPHLEIMGCECFVPDASEVTALDDPLELLRRCRALGLTIPQHFLLRSTGDLAALYERDAFRASDRYVMLAAGPAGMRDRAEILLPSTVAELRNQRHEISERRPWVVIGDPGGRRRHRRFVTCTTLKESRIVANVTCRVDEERGLVPEERPEVTLWLERFFARSFGARINGHVSFRLTASEETDELLPIGCRVGVGLPYICHTGIHPRLVWKPCRHFSRQNSSSRVASNGQSLSDAVAGALKRTNSGETAPHLLGTVLDKRGSLFVYWDPLPYCAYYHLQLPFRRVAEVIRTQHNPPLAVVR